MAAISCGGETVSSSPSSVPTASAASAPAASASGAPAPAPGTASTPVTSPAVAARLPALTAQQIDSLLAASDRTEADRKVDKVRHPDRLLAFIGVRPGMRVADLGAGGGYTTELLARAVGPGGKVYSQNDPQLVERFLEKPIAQRLARAANKNVVRVDRAFDDPLPPEASGLDLVVDYIFYHDIVWIGADRAKMNKAIFNALKPGAAYVIVDASAKPGNGIKDAKTLHRIDENVARNEVLEAGFRLGETADFLRNPGDSRDWNSSPRAAGDRVGTEDRFVFEFVKP